MAAIRCGSQECPDLIARPRIVFVERQSFIAISLSAFGLSGPVDAMVMVSSALGLSGMCVGGQVGSRQRN
ncbi:MAG: hypothetical protein AAGC93_26955, partial [Cyanobacteria bacterium P01_F01_bin.53]